MKKKRENNRKKYVAQHILRVYPKMKDTRAVYSDIICMGTGQRDRGRFLNVKYAAMSRAVTSITYVQRKATGSRR